jgi:hypothetical protein
MTPPQSPGDAPVALHTGSLPWELTADSPARALPRFGRARRCTEIIAVRGPAAA